MRCRTLWHLRCAIAFFNLLVLPFSPDKYQKSWSCHLSFIPFAVDHALHQRITYLHYYQQVSWRLQVFKGLLLLPIWSPFTSECTNFVALTFVDALPNLILDPKKTAVADDQYKARQHCHVCSDDAQQSLCLVEGSLFANDSWTLGLGSLHFLCEPFHSCGCVLALEPWHFVWRVTRTFQLLWRREDDFSSFSYSFKGVQVPAHGVRALLLAVIVTLLAIGAGCFGLSIT